MIWVFFVFDKWHHFDRVVQPFLLLGYWHSDESSMICNLSLNFGANPPISISIESSCRFMSNIILGHSFQKPDTANLQQIIIVNRGIIISIFINHDIVIFSSQFFNLSNMVAKQLSLILLTKYHSTLVS
jgi:hypothetical protein